MPERDRKLAILGIAAATIFQLTLSASAQTASPTTGASASKASSASHDMSSHSGDMKKSMENMSAQMASTPMTGDADRDFAVMMKIHHQGAIDMAQAQLVAGKDPEMRKLAKEIIAAQKKEIALIDRWLKR